MKNIVLTIFILFSCIYTFSQVDKFNLEEYKLPEYKYQLLDLGFGTNSNYSNYQFPKIDTSTIINRSKNYGRYIDRRTNFRIHPTFRSYGNTPQLQKYSSVSFVWSNSNNYDEYINRSSLNDQVSDLSKSNNLSFLILNDRRFYNSRKQFIKMGSIIDWDRFSDQSIDIGKQITETTFQDYKRNVKNKRSELEAELSVGVGKGRIEEVQDARQAIYIFEELSAYGILQRNFSKNDILDFAKKLSSTKRQRFLDSRNRWKYITTEIDSFLTENNFCAKSNNIEYYNTLWEFLNYGSMFTRTAGQRIEFNFTPMYIQKNSGQEVTYKSLTDNNVSPIYMRQDSTYSYDYYSSLNQLLKLTFDFNYNLAKPINLNWQYNLNTRVKGGIINGNSNTTRNNILSSIIVINDLNKFNCRSQKY